MRAPDGFARNALAAADGRSDTWRRIAVLGFAVGIVVYRDAIMDDTFIHMQYAHNLRASGEIAFNAGEPSLGATSPLWMLLLAAVGASEHAARVLSVACGAISVFVFAGIARRVFGVSAWAHAATIVWAGSLWLVRHAPNGMESTAAALAVLLVIALRLRGGRHSGRDVLVGATLAAAVLLRPETAVLAVLLLLDDVRSSWGRGRIATWLPIFALPILAWAWFAHDRTGLFLPNTGTAKSGGFGFEPLVWMRVLWRQAQVVGAAHAVEAIGVLAALAIGLRRGTLRDIVGHPLAVYGVFALALVGGYAVADVQIQPRYLLPILPCLVLVGFAAWRRVLGDRPRAAAATAAACLLVGHAIGALTVYGPTREFARGLRTVLVPMALDVKEREIEPKLVATPDIGVMAFHSGARILDLGGLVDARVQAMVDSIGYDAMLEEGAFLAFGRPDFVVDRSPDRERFAGHETHGLVWRPLRTGVVQGLGISRPRPYYYTLYALEPRSAFGHRTPSGDILGNAFARR